jgi:hypothetical protein
MFQPVAPEGMRPYLPEDPLPGQLVQIPDSVDGGSAVHITILNDQGVLIGESQQLFKVENVSLKWQLGRTVTTVPLRPETCIRVHAERRKYKSLMFVEYFGWVGSQYRDDAEVLSDRTYYILHAAPYANSKNGPNIYELVCLQVNDEGETNARIAPGSSASDDGSTTEGPDAPRDDAAPSPTGPTSSTP